MQVGAANGHTWVSVKTASLPLNRLEGKYSEAVPAYCFEDEDGIRKQRRFGVTTKLEPLFVHPSERRYRLDICGVT